MTIPSFSSLNRLSGLLEIGTQPDASTLQSAVVPLQAAGFVDAYLGDIFLEVVPRDHADPSRQIFDEGSCVLQFRTEAVYEMVRETLAVAGLSTESAHYNQVLPPPGGCEADEWLWAYHARMMQIAGRLGLKRVTTHPGWMFGSAMEDYVGPAAQAYHDRRISQTELNHLAKMAYGGDAVIWRDSVELYKRLCDLAAAVGVRVTIETAVSEWYDLTLHVERMHTFCDAVGAANLGICVDSGHCHLNGLDVPAILRACGSRMWETHFHDNYGERDEHNPLGEGTIPWPAVVRALHAIEYTGVITFEQRAHAVNGERWRALTT